MKSNPFFEASKAIKKMVSAKLPMLLVTSVNGKSVTFTGWVEGSEPFTMPIATMGAFAMQIANGKALSDYLRLIDADESVCMFEHGDFLCVRTGNNIARFINRERAEVVQMAQKARKPIHRAQSEIDAEYSAIRSMFEVKPVKKIDLKTYDELSRALNERLQALNGGVPLADMPALAPAPVIDPPAKRAPMRKRVMLENEWAYNLYDLAEDDERDDIQRFKGEFSHYSKSPLGLVIANFTTKDGLRAVNVCALVDACANRLPAMPARAMRVHVGD